MVGGRQMPAHRYGWELRNGPIPEGLLALHHCDNPPCVRPDHLFPGSQAENVEDRDRKGRTARGERVSRARLTEEQVKEIRRRYRPRHPTDGGRALAREFGVDDAAVTHVVRGRDWRHVLVEE
jgi:hypothetical protein